MIDPLGGSYYVEQLTDQVEREAFSYIEKIDALGGMLRAVELGFPQKEIAEASYQYQMRVDSNQYVVVGVNDYKDEHEDQIPTLAIDHSSEKKQIDRIKAFKAGRDAKAWDASIAEIRTACKEGRNVMPSLIAGVDRGVTLGEVCDIYREVFGVYTDPGLI